MPCSHARYLPATIALALIAGCGSAPNAPVPKPSHAELVAHESELLKLTREAQTQLGIVTVKVGEQSAARTRKSNGEIVVPASNAAATPIGSGSDIAQLAAQPIAADAEVGRARAQWHLPEHQW